ncbi:hypothetical protein V492_06808 [Pseudogymnoascus sp. VKM F-4246]|nr:hypothetical protein V492_06808 [Pseudogymnoascus sp. VKM F-4246]
MTQPDFHGLTWISETFGVVPRWSLEPDPASIAELIKSLGVQDATITFLAQGAFNKVYTVTSPSHPDVILRLALPVDPRFKTLSEVATMEWMLHHTSAPLPRVLRYGESRANIVGMEWMLLTKVPGKHLGDVWRTLSYGAKEALVRRVAGIWAEMFRRPMRGIGNIYSGGAEVGRIVSMQFFWANHVHRDVWRGPFKTSREWILARLELYENECLVALERWKGDADEECDEDNGDDGGDEDDEDEEFDGYDKEMAEKTLGIVTRLKPLVDKIFPIGQQEEEQSVLFHNDLSNHNVLVDHDGTLTGMLDWECVSAVPLWKACDFPSFLTNERPREVEPVLAPQDIDNEDAIDYYWESMKQYEVMKLRRFFLDEMARLEPGWVEVFDASLMKRELDHAVVNCDSEIDAWDIRCWSGNVMAEKSNMLTLEDRRWSCYGPDATKDDIVKYVA